MLSYVDAFKWVYSRLPGHRKKQFWILFAGMTSAAFLETAALGAVAFFASTVTDPRVVLDSRYIAGARDILSALALPTGFLTTPNSLILATGLAMLFMITLKNSLKAIVEYWMARFGVGIEAFFGGWLLQGFLNRPYQWHLTCNTADLVNAVSWRTYLGRNFFQPCLKIFNSLLMVFIMVTALFVVQPAVSLIVVGILGSAAVFIYRVIRSQIDKAATAARDFQIAINKEATMAIHGIKDVKIALKESLFVSKFLEKAEPLSRILGVQRFYAQSLYIYDATLAENVAFGMDPKDIDREQVKKCCTMASMDDFLHDLTHGIDSFIGERGVRLSGGQQQRVAIARALYDNTRSDHKSLSFYRLGVDFA